MQKSNSSRTIREHLVTFFEERFPSVPKQTFLQNQKLLLLLLKMHRG